METPWAALSSSSPASGVSMVSSSRRRARVCAFEVVGGLNAHTSTRARLDNRHQGLSAFEYTPIGRGFDSFMGFLGGGEDHVTQRINTGRTPG